MSNSNKEECKQCGQPRKYLDEKGICVVCERGKSSNWVDVNYKGKEPKRFP